jgi:hypothetical protein
VKIDFSNAVSEDIRLAPAYSTMGHPSQQSVKQSFDSKKKLAINMKKPKTIKTECVSL